MTEFKRREKNIPLNISLQNDIKVMQKELGLDQYKFPF